MTMQRLCHGPVRATLMCLCVSVSLVSSARAAEPGHDYPTHARVEFVNECVGKQRGPASTLYQCACVIDHIAQKMSYDDFVESWTFARYSGLPGEGKGIFRDSDHAKSMAKRYRETEAAAYRSCGLEAR